MAITKGAKKAHRASLKKRVYNVRRLRKAKDVTKEIKKLLESGDISGAEKKLPEAYKALDKASKMNTIKKNNASRKKSRLALAIKKAKNSN